MKPLGRFPSVLGVAALPFAGVARGAEPAADDARFREVMNDIVAALVALTEEGQNNLPVDTVDAEGRVHVLERADRARV